jgi:hypothetical protein
MRQRERERERGDIVIFTYIFGQTGAQQSPVVHEYRHSGARRFVTGFDAPAAGQLARPLLPLRRSFSVQSQSVSHPFKETAVPLHTLRLPVSCKHSGCADSIATCTTTHVHSSYAFMLFHTLMAAAPHLL